MSSIYLSKQKFELPYTQISSSINVRLRTNSLNTLRITMNLYTQQDLEGETIG